MNAFQIRRHAGKFPPNPHHGRIEHLTARRSDLLSLISYMETNRLLQAASWQIESLRESLRIVEHQLSATRTPPKHVRNAAHPGKSLELRRDSGYRFGIL
jgi:hypothetical protein